MCFFGALLFHPPRPVSVLVARATRQRQSQSSRTNPPPPPQVPCNRAPHRPRFRITGFPKSHNRALLVHGLGFRVSYGWSVRQFPGALFRSLCMVSGTERRARTKGHQFQTNSACNEGIEYSRDRPSRLGQLRTKPSRASHHMMNSKPIHRAQHKVESLSWKLCGIG